jgi:hypothetical protein
MALSVFDDTLKPPQPKDLAATLGKTFVFWNQLRTALETRFGPLSFEWGFTSKSTGWGTRVKTEKRTILYMTPCEGYFLASLALGEKSVKMAHEAKLQVSVLRIIDNAKKYAEGRGVRLEVRSASDVRAVENLAIIKMLV